jgi:hypothetical protein
LGSPVAGWLQAPKSRLDAKAYAGDEAPPSSSSIHDEWPETFLFDRTEISGGAHSRVLRSERWIRVVLRVATTPRPIHAGVSYCAFAIRAS